MVLHALNRKMTVRLKLLRDEPHSNVLSQEKIEYVVETGVVVYVQGVILFAWHGQE